MKTDTVSAAYKMEGDSLPNILSISLKVFGFSQYSYI